MQLAKFVLGAPPQVELADTMLPRDYQLTDYLDALTYPRWANYSQVGTGKSLVSYLWIMHKLYEGKGVIVMMPPPLLTQYIRNFGVITGHQFVFDRFHEDRNKRISVMKKWDDEGWPDVIFMSYDMFRTYSSRLWGITKYKAVVCDEAHILSNFRNKTFQRLYYMLEDKQMDTLLMTGTPCTTEVETAYGQIKIRYPGAYHNFEQFERKHINYRQHRVDGADGRTKTIKIVDGYKDLPEVKSWLMKGATRRLTREVLPLHEPTLIDQLVVLSKAHSELYAQLMSERMIEFETRDEIVLARTKQKLRQLALQIITNMEDFTEKETLMVDEPYRNLAALVDSIDLCKRKVLIFCEYQSTVKKLQTLLNKYNPAVIFGGSNTQKNVDKFQQDETCRMAILNFRSGGAGFNFQNEAHQAIVFEALGSPGLLEQCIGRVHRGGQKYPVQVWLFRYALTMSSDLLDKLPKRNDEIKEVLGDSESLIDFIREGDTSDTQFMGED